jgi:diguanylate cyclase
MVFSEEIAMQEAIKQRRKGMLKLVKSSGAIKNEQRHMTGCDYYRQVEHYAEQIRRTHNADEIIRILDIVLSDTRGLKFNDEVFAAQEQIKCAEQKIESLKSELEQLRGLVHTDQVTGAFNQRGLDDIFKREAARADRNAQTLGVVLINLDNFKQINDRLDHSYGDSVLINLVTIAKETLRSTDAVARCGDEEFVILLPDVEMEEALTITCRLQNNFTNNSLLKIDNQLISITFSAGVALRSFGEPQHSVLNRVEQALSQAKRTGKNCTIPALVGLTVCDGNSIFC